MFLHNSFLGCKMPSRYTFTFVMYDTFRNMKGIFDLDLVSKTLYTEYNNC